MDIAAIYKLAYVEHYARPEQERPNPAEAVLIPVDQCFDKSMIGC